MPCFQFNMSNSTNLKDLPLLFPCFTRPIKVIVVNHAITRTTQTLILVIHLP
jgi:hypothetical protein